MGIRERHGPWDVANIVGFLMYTTVLGNQEYKEEGSLRIMAACIGLCNFLTLL